MHRKVAIYYPRTFPLPIHVEREFLWDKRNMDHAPLTQEDWLQYDSKTLFFDVFWAADKQTLICIGPPFVNIGPPLSIKHKGQSLNFTMPFLADKRITFPLCAVLYISLKGIRRHDMLSISIKFKDFDIEIPCPLPSTLLDKKVNLMLATMQKDSPIIWIKDWCQWHSRMHGVQRIIIYDNGSSVEYSIKKLSKELAELDMEILLIHWPFPHGPHWTWQNHFTHPAAINHCRLFWGHLSRWCINMDIDEYIYLESSSSLQEYLQQRYYAPVIYLDSYLALPEKKRMNRLLRSFDCTLRYPQMRNFNFKYIYQPERILYSHHHRAINKVDNFSNWKHRFIRLWRRIKNLSFMRKGKTMKRAEIFYYHFYTLNTGWKSSDRHWSTPVSVHKFARLVQDERLRNKAKKGGILTS